MVITSALSMVMSRRVEHLLDELTARYIPAYGHLARANIRSLERALALRRMVIAKMQVPPDEEAYAARLRFFQEKDDEVEQEAGAARKLINAIIDDVSTPSDNAALARIENRIDNAMTEGRARLGEEQTKLLKQLDSKDFAETRATLARVDTLRDQLTQKIDAIRADMLSQVFASTSIVIRDQQQAIDVSAVVTGLAAALGLGFAFLVSSGITRPVRRLLQGTQEIEAGHFDQLISVSTKDEIGQLSAAFNRMVEQLRRNERIRETFGRYIDPRVVEGLLDRPDAATQGQRRLMTVMFCDMKGFTSMSEGMTPQGLVKVMNCYLTMMSEPIRERRGVIDKYIGDAIMAYWGPPFIEEADQARLACLAAIDMVDRVPKLRKQLPELLGVRVIPTECDIRIGIATGEVLTGSIGSDLMMSFTVMGDAVNLASRLEAVNKVYGCRILISEATAATAGTELELREIDRLAVVGQSMPQAVFEVMGRHGELTKQRELLRSRYKEGLAAYRIGRWEEARKAFNAGLEVSPGDGPSLALLSRVDHLQSNPPPADWNGSWHMEHK
ncbi:adenylate/guanylate cyclase domain-containing protein [Bradyrhizobium sp. CB82]|uniref:adenylate/guanylate cyclase domain-containing protein n=1 Tax=Bradyrhizobium sp. CB82 TaxID=3039159 RepID=UPI0024B08ECC|nr:adenylate/guanylate cyclase domain-containing protein [Bradyrhizobium sp. CB82]WFU45009.1 adenylate/guanylate cyclase domain-containing protein [Bradyrhizobium sp. CB82]